MEQKPLSYIGYSIVNEQSIAALDLMMNSFEIVHNMPAPYRYPIFRELYRQLRESEIRFHVHFMARNHHDRPHFEPDPRDLNFPHSFWGDVGPTLSYNDSGSRRKKEWHLNPAMLTHLLKKRPDYLMVGGPWDSLTGMFASLSSRRQVGIAWWESNTSNPGRINGWVATMKRLLLKQYDIFAVPGEEGVRHAELIVKDPSVRNKCVLLPNLIDDQRFTPGWTAENHDTRLQMRERLGIAPDVRFAIWPARLIREKGIPEFLSTVSSHDLAGWKIVIFGQGPLDSAVRAVIRDRSLDQHVRLESYIEYNEMPAAYQAADLLLLPSIEDSNPLTVVEALHAGLPLLLSNKVGNFPEALKEGVNGWALDPYCEDSVRGAVRRAFGASFAELQAMGEESKRIGENFWGLELAIRRFLVEVLAHREKKRLDAIVSR